MKTIKELEKTLTNDNEVNFAYKTWYITAISWVLEDIQSSSTLSVESIEKYLKDLLTN